MNGKWNLDSFRRIVGLAFWRRKVYWIVRFVDASSVLGNHALRVSTHRKLQMDFHVKHTTMH
jgi:hypothetical protein